jgi:hypothetical protein
MEVVFNLVLKLLRKAKELCLHVQQILCTQLVERSKDSQVVIVIKQDRKLIVANLCFCRALGGGHTFSRRLKNRDTI